METHIVALGVVLGALPLYWMAKDVEGIEAMVIRVAATIAFWLGLGVAIITWLF